jgi:hypothetical protein
MAREEHSGQPAAGSGPDEAGALTIHQRMMAEIEAALCARDPAAAAAHVRLANDYARRCAEPAGRRAA